VTWAFDTDVLIYAAAPSHPLGSRVLQLFERGQDAVVGVGSLVLLTEMLTKPLRADPKSAEALVLAGLLAQLDLRPLDRPTALIAVDLGVKYGLAAPDAIHLATAVYAGATWFLTNNRRDFTKGIEEIDVVYPTDLPTAPLTPPHGARDSVR
jgi:predicted nucleic acid-binding protein